MTKEAAAAKEDTYDDLSLAALYTAKSTIEFTFAFKEKREFEYLMRGLGGEAKMVPWLVGDALVEGEKRFGEEWVQLAEMSGLSISTLRQYYWVAKSVPSHRRVEGVDFSIHRLVAKFEAAIQSKYLKLARRDGMNSRQVREQMIADGVIEERPKKSAVEKFQAVWRAASAKAREEIAGLIDDWRREQNAKAAKKARAKDKPKLRAVKGDKSKAKRKK